MAGLATPGPLRGLTSRLGTWMRVRLTDEAHQTAGTGTGPTEVPTAPRMRPDAYPDHWTPAILGGDE
jgi:hypothetical protein